MLWEHRARELLEWYELDQGRPFRTDEFEVCHWPEINIKGTK